MNHADLAANVTLRCVLCKKPQLFRLTDGAEFYACTFCGMGVPVDLTPWMVELEAPRRDLHE